LQESAEAGDERRPLSSLDRAYRILDAFETTDRHLTLGEIALRTGIPKSTVHRIATSLVEWGALDRGSGAGFSLGMRLFELGELVPARRVLRDLAMPFLEDLFEITHETINFVIPDGVEVVYLEKFSGHRRVDAPSRPGGRLPMYSTAVGKAIMAHSDQRMFNRVVNHGLTPLTKTTITQPDVLRRELAEVAAMSVAFDRGEAHAGLSCVAAPVFAPGKRVVGALSVCGPDDRFDAGRAAQAVRAAALALSRQVPRPR